MKNIKWRLLSELMKNSRRSDRELAKVLGASQPTVSRTRRKLEKEGYIKEYTLIPEFSKLGYHIMAVTLFKYATGLEREKVLEARKKAKAILKESLLEMVITERGNGIGYDGVTISFHKDYGSYIQFINLARQLHPVAAIKMDSFLVSLDDKVRYRPLTFSTLAKHLLKLKEE